MSLFFRVLSRKNGFWSKTQMYKTCRLTVGTILKPVMNKNIVHKLAHIADGEKLEYLCRQEKPNV